MVVFICKNEINWRYIFFFRFWKRGYKHLQKIHFYPYRCSKGETSLLSFENNLSKFWNILDKIKNHEKLFFWDTTLLFSISVLCPSIWYNWFWVDNTLMFCPLKNNGNFIDTATVSIVSESRYHSRFINVLSVQN